LDRPKAISTTTNLVIYSYLDFISPLISLHHQTGCIYFGLSSAFDLCLASYFATHTLCSLAL